MEAQPTALADAKAALRADIAGPSNWRDVYTLVRDTRADVLDAVTAVDEKVTALDLRVGAVEHKADFYANREVGIFGVLKSGQVVVITAIATVSLLLSLYHTLSMS